MSDFEEFIKSIEKEDLAEVKRLYTKEFINKKKLNCEWSALHVASYHNSKGDIVKYLLSKGYDIEETTKSGLRSIHLSISGDRVEVLTALIEGGCDITSLNEYNETALNLAIRLQREECADILKCSEERRKDTQEQLENNSLSMIMNLTKKTLLDTLLCNNDPRIMEAIKAKEVNDQEITEWRSMNVKRVEADSYRLLHECLLTRCLYQRYEDGVYDLCSADIVNRESLFMGPTALETAIECGVSIFSVKHILWKLVKEDESWERAHILAEKKNNQRIISLIRKRRRYLKNKEKNGFNILHIAVLKDDPDMIAYILKNKVVNVDEGDKKNGTALSLSYYIGNEDCIDCLQNNNANVNTVDRFKHSPLHIAIYNRIEDRSDYLLNHIIDTDAKDFMNFTLLERSVMNDCKNICEKLVKMGAKYDKYVNIYANLDDEDIGMIFHNTPCKALTKKETIYTLCLKVNKTIFTGLLDVIDQNTINLTDGDGNSLLHLCAVMLLPNICYILLRKSIDINLKNENRNTPLMELLKQNYQNDKEMKNEFIEAINLLIGSGASLNETDVYGCSLLEIATKYHSEELLRSLLHKTDVLTFLNKSQWLAWLHKKHYTLIKEVIPLINKSLLIQWITPDLIKDILQDQEIMLSKTLYYKASCEVQIEVLEVILQKAAIIEEITLFEEMLNHELSLKINLDKGETLMTWLIKERKIKFINLAFRSRNIEIFLEKENVHKKLPLHVCIEYEFWDFIDQLIVETVSVNKEDSEGNTPLSLLFTKISETDDEQKSQRLIIFVKNIIIKSGDIYKENKLKRTAISYCLRLQLKLEIESFFRKFQNTPQKAETVVQPGVKLPTVCSICDDNPVDCAVNCGHMFCMSCAERVVNCFICRTRITNRIKLFI